MGTVLTELLPEMASFLDWLSSSACHRSRRIHWSTQSFLRQPSPDQGWGVDHLAVDGLWMIFFRKSASSPCFISARHYQNKSVLPKPFWLVHAARLRLNLVLVTTAHGVRHPRCMRYAICHSYLIGFRNINAHLMGFIWLNIEIKVDANAT